MSDAPQRPSRTQRLLDLLAFLSGHRRSVAADRIMRGVPGYATVDDDAAAREAARRKFERDKAALRDLGVPLETERRVVRGEEELRYRLPPRSFYLPVMKLLAEGEAPPQSSTLELAVRVDELRAAVEALVHVQELPAFPLRREARSALDKITFDLAGDVIGDPARVRHLPPFDPAEMEDVLERISGALRRRKTLRFDYYSIARDRSEPREVHARGILYQGSRWYLVAHDLARGAERVFRVDRMSGVEVEGSRPRTPDYDLPDGYSLAAYRDREAWELGEESEIEVRVRFRHPLSLLADRNHWGEPVAPRDGGEETGDVERRFRVRSPDPLLRWLLTHGRSVEVSDPPELARRLEGLRTRVLKAHR